MGINNKYTPEEREIKAKIEDCQRQMWRLRQNYINIDTKKQMLISKLKGKYKERVSVLPFLRGETNETKRKQIHKER